MSARYGRGFSYPALTRMQRFAAWLPQEAAVATLSQQLSWSHVVELLPLPDPLQREFYARMGAAERWSVCTLRERIDSMLYERTALSRRPRAQIEQELAALRHAEHMTPALLLRDPYLLDFLGLRDTWSESDLEAAIAREKESFLLELGAGFTFVARPAYKGQMELHLRWLDRHERQPGEEPPLGIILCAGKKREQIELLELDAAGIHVAQYLTQLPPRELLAERLQQAAAQARQQIERRAPTPGHEPDSND